MSKEGRNQNDEGRGKSKRVDVNPKQGGLNAAFSGLNITNLPVGPAEPPKPAQAPAPARKMGRVVLRREMARRGGKTVIVVHDFATHLRLSEIEDIARRLRSACGCGGTVKDRTIEIQGDQPAKIRAFLEKEGFQVAGIK